jgi:hypothetical protein
MIPAECLECDGSGRVERMFVGSSAASEPVFRSAECSYCGGSGEVPETCADCGDRADMVCPDGHPRCDGCATQLSDEAAAVLAAIEPTGRVEARLAKIAAEIGVTPAALADMQAKQVLELQELAANENDAA